MDRLVVEKEAEIEQKIETKTQPQKQTISKPAIETQIQQNTKKNENKIFEQTVCVEEEVEETEIISQNKTEYLSSLENMTIADFKKQEDEKKYAEFEKEKEVLIAQQYEKKEEKKEEKQVSQNIIKKPNYDLIEDNKKVIKFKQQTKAKKKNNKKLASIVIACALGASSIIAVTNCVIIDNMNSNFMQIDETYKLNLAKYLKNINNLDQAQNSMEMIETYPEELLEAGDVGEKSNWFDRLCNFIGGIFGG